MQPQIIYEYDPATGQSVATSLPDDLFAVDLTGNLPPPPPGFAGYTASHLQLSSSGKDKLRRRVAEAASLDELADIDAALDAGEINDQLAAKLGLSDSDYLPAAPSQPHPAFMQGGLGAPASSSGGRRVSEAGKHKLRLRAVAATSLDELADIEALIDAEHVSDAQVVKFGLKVADLVVQPVMFAQMQPMFAHAPATSSAAVVMDLFPPRRLSMSGKNKLRHHVATATSMELLAEIEGALDAGEIGDALGIKLGLLEVDFANSGAAPQAPAAAPSAQTQPAQPQAAVGAMGLTPSGLAKVRKAIHDASDMTLLSTLDTALKRGDIPRLRSLLTLLPEDLQEQEVLVDDEPIPGEEDEDYDPFSTAPPVQAETEEKDMQAPEAAQSAATGPAKEAGDEERPTKKRKKGKKDKENSKKLAWPLEWAWLVSRTVRHADFRAPAVVPESKWAQPEAADGKKKSRAMLVALSTSSVYAGDPAGGYDPRHLARISAVDEYGNVLLDMMVRPRQAVLDYRTHFTGLRQESFSNALDFDTARARLLELLQPETLLVGHRLATELESLKLWHGTVVDVSLIYGVETRKQFQYHPLRYLAEHVIGAQVDEDSPHDSLEDAKLILRLAQHESKHSVPTPPFAPKPGNTCELAVRHLPLDWRAEAVKHVSNLVPGSKIPFVVNWLLSEADPTDWRGEAVLEFQTTEFRDAAFEALVGLTDVHVQWEDLPGAPPLGAFLTEQSLMKAFSRFGPVVSARVPRKPTTREPQSFAFISFLNRDDATRVAKEKEIEVELGPDWNLPLRPRLAKFGQSTDKRIAICVGEDTDLTPSDWVHVFRR